MGKRAIGVIRVSRVKGRDKDERLHSPATQRERIEQTCSRQGFRLKAVYDENEGTAGKKLRDASGAKPLAERAKLLKAVEDVEAGRADALVFADASRFTWTQSVREEVLARIEPIGGEVWADDTRQSNGSAVEEFSGTTITAAQRLLRRQAAEKARDAQVEAVEAGTWMAARIPPGYVLGKNRRLAPDPKTAPVVAEAFRMRAAGATIEDVRLYLREHGIERTYKAVGLMLHSRVVLGELHFGDLHNLSAHPAIVDRATWERVQRVSAPSGPKAESERLLARLGVLRCGSCGSRMSVTTSNYRYPAYRCGQAEYCKRRVTISAELAEQTVVRATREALADVKGRASAEGRRREAAAALATADANLQAAFRAFAGMESEPGARERLQELREARDKAQEQLDELGGLGAVVTFSPTTEWDRLTLDEQRAFISATIASATVAPGRGSDRIEIKLK